MAQAQTKDNALKIDLMKQAVAIGKKAGDKAQIAIASTELGQMFVNALLILISQRIKIMII